MGELEPWIDEGFVRQIWFNLGEQVNVKMIRDKFSGYVVPFSCTKLVLTNLCAEMLDTASLTSMTPRQLRRLYL